MRYFFFLIFVLILSANCAVNTTEAQKQPAPLPDKNFNVSVEIKSLRPANEREIAEIEAVQQKERERQARIPAEFKNIDFKNSTYFSSHLGSKIKLKDGKIENEKDRWRSEFQTVEYIDLAKDADKEALVELTETTVGGSSFTSFNYYLYEMRGGKPNLLWKLSTGSESNCGHKSVKIENRRIILEVFGDCSLTSRGMKNSDPHFHSDIEADMFTRFEFGWNGRKFVQKKREALPYPEREVHKNLYENTLRSYSE